MRRSVLALLFSLSLAACTNTHVSQLEVYNHRSDETWLLRQASGGNADAQLQLGHYYCEMEPKGSGNPKAVQWWERAAANRTNSIVVTEAMQYLGEYYLAMYVNENYDPQKNKKVSYCAGRRAGDTDYAAAEKWLLECAKTDAPFATICNLGLGHLYSSRKQYDKAYFWFATLLASRLESDFDPKTGERNRRGMWPIDAKFFGVVDARNARRAASHLSRGKVESINAKAVKWMKDWDDKAGDAIDASVRQQNAKNSD